MITRFGADNRGTIACFHCGKLSWASRVRALGVNDDTCPDCGEEFSLENEHNDYGGHPNGAINGRPSRCPICHPEYREARLARVKARNSELAAAAQTRIAAQQARYDAKVAEKAAVKRCIASDCITGNDGLAQRASATSDYCSTCRPYHPHAAVKQTAKQREFSAKHGFSLTSCGLCGQEITEEIHA